MGVLCCPFNKKILKKLVLCSMKFFLQKLSTGWPCIEYCYHIWAGAPKRCIDILDKFQKQVCKAVGPALSDSLEPLSGSVKPVAPHCDVAGLSLLYRYYFGNAPLNLLR